MMTPESKISLSLNVINFLFYGGISCIAPFLSVHMRAVGLTVRHTVWVHIASGLVCILVPLLIGSIAEKKRSSPIRYLYKCCFSASLFIAMVGYAGLLAVPKVQRVHKQPQIDFDCSSPMNALINVEKCANYETCSDLAAAWSPNTRFRLSHCVFKYREKESKKPNPPDPLQMCFRTARNSTHHCLVYDPHVRDNPTLEFTSDLTTWLFTEYRNVSTKEFLGSTSTHNFCNYVPATSGTVIKVNNKIHDAVSCQRSLSEKVIGINCVLYMDPVDTKRPDCFDIIGNLSLTFWWYLGMRVLGDAFFICAICLLEGISLRAIQSGPYHRGVYGRSRMAPAGAMVIFPVIVGILVDYFSDIAESPDYSPAYFIFCACEFITCVLVYVLPLPVGGNTFKYTPTPTRNYGSEQHFTLEMVIIAIVTAMAGTAWGFSQVFDPLLYATIHLNNLLLGLAQSFVFLFALPFLWVSKQLIQNIGEHNLLSAAFAFHSLHLAGLSLAQDWLHWWGAAPFEAMKAFTVPILWLALVAAVEHDNGKGKRIGMHYVLVVVHFGIGRLLGCAIGGLVAEKYSISISYRVLSIFSLIMSVSYLTLHHCYMKPRHRKIVAARCALQRQSVNGSCLLLMPINGEIITRSD